MKLLIVIVFTLISSIACAENWKEYYKSDSSTHLLDIDSITYPEADKVRAWEKVIFSNGDGSKSSTEVNCEEKTFTIKSLKALDPKDIDIQKELDVALKDWTEPEQHWNFFEPSELHNALYKTCCITYRK